MNRTVLIVGIVIVAAVVVMLFVGLGKDPQQIDSPLIGKPAPPFALKAVGTGETIDLASLRGKPVVLNFWATWCGAVLRRASDARRQRAQMLPNVQFLGVVFQGHAKTRSMRLPAASAERAYPTLVDDERQDRDRLRRRRRAGDVLPRRRRDDRGQVRRPDDRPNILQANLAEGAPMIATFFLLALLQLKVPDAAQFVGRRRARRSPDRSSKQQHDGDLADASLSRSVRGWPSATRRRSWPST